MVPWIPRGSTSASVLTFVHDPDTIRFKNNQASSQPTSGQPNKPMTEVAPPSPTAETL